ncbi:MAG TPA: hypothetical protein VKA85_01675 [Candidatus Limnocylindrales bacterium]|nr:hypothetical protein [Candidatus Limnocylindrales bacterium]
MSPRHAADATPVPFGDAEALQILLAEYAALQKALDLAWTLSQQRTNVFFAVLSATAVSVGLVVQATGDRAAVVPFTIVVLGLASFVGIATYVRVVQALQEATFAILGMNRIRRHLRDRAPATAPYFTLPMNDDEASLHRGVGGMYGHGAERLSYRYALLHVHGVVAVLSGCLAGSGVAFAVAQIVSAPAVSLAAGVAACVVVVVVLFRHLHASVSDLRRSWNPVFPASKTGGGTS